jgi:hypothetical protein
LLVLVLVVAELSGWSDLGFDMLPSLSLVRHVRSTNVPVSLMAQGQPARL